MKPSLSALLNRSAHYTVINLRAFEGLVCLAFVESVACGIMGGLL